MEWAEYLSGITRATAGFMLVVDSKQGDHREVIAKKSWRREIIFCF